jgi:hypothetical protein
MTNEEFLRLRNELNDHCEQLLGLKKLEYSENDADRLCQFTAAAGLLGVHPAKALCGMMVKHETSIHSMVKALDKGKDFTLEQWKEKIGDLRNYCDLLWATIIDNDWEPCDD